MKNKSDIESKDRLLVSDSCLPGMWNPENCTLSVSVHPSLEWRCNDSYCVDKLRRSGEITSVFTSSVLRAS